MGMNVSKSLGGPDAQSLPKSVNMLIWSLSKYKRGLVKYMSNFQVRSASQAKGEGRRDVICMIGVNSDISNDRKGSRITMQDFESSMWMSLTLLVTETSSMTKSNSAKYPSPVATMGTKYFSVVLSPTRACSDPASRCFLSRGNSTFPSHCQSYDVLEICPMDLQAWRTFVDSLNGM